MKKSFTLVEILIVIVILGIVATIAINIISEIFKNYYYTRAFNRLLFESDTILNQIAKRLSNRVKNSVIALKCDASKDECINGIVHDFLPLSVVTEDIQKYYPVIEWIGIDEYSYRGEWNGSRIIPGFSGFVDLKKTQTLGDDTYIITTPYSNFNIVKEIDSNWTKQWGIEGDIFKNRLEVLIFSGPDDRGDFLDINNSYGYYGGKATRVFEIDEKKSSFNNNEIYIKAIDTSNSTSVFEKYYLVNSAFAIVPVCNRVGNSCRDYNLTIFFNYHPWNKKRFIDGNSSLLVAHVTQFKFREDGIVLRLYMCISDPKVIINNEPLTVCKEKVVF